MSVLDLHEEQQTSYHYMNLKIDHEISNHTLKSNTTQKKSYYQSSIRLASR